MPSIPIKHKLGGPAVLEALSKSGGQRGAEKERTHLQTLESKTCGAATRTGLQLCNFIEITVRLQKDP
jgi:hypothetical protein